MGYLYQQVCSIFKFESFNTTHQAFHSIINEKKDVFVNLTIGAGNHLFITPLIIVVSPLINSMRDQVKKTTRSHLGVSAVSLLSGIESDEEAKALDRRRELFCIIWHSMQSHC